ncbi:TIGR03089 family protein [Corynebacterium doosanense]|uniref:TIGR03089 family protein n=1 Tax=Corynebacterium doosanense CAU 212 = DSM 45436 TaxID=558173 RepID=A0A097IE80_9CORY|nr:TIGR03089 family protein [Corynebacterium doosanense]AIT60434.1 hypothetical protein CDOO_03590 [Corynebacterium doosanense CAU 212 = DSM 45436]
MRLLENLLTTDPASPRLTVYNETTGARMDFSAQTLDNWASKIANMLGEELDLDPSSAIAIDLPVSWQAAVTALGAVAARIEVRFGGPSAVGEVDAVFTSLERYDAWASSGADAVLVSDDPFGRGIEESGGTLPAGALDFGPIVRFYGDVYYGDAPALSSVVPDGTPERLLSTGWTDRESFQRDVLSPIAAGGSSVVVAGRVSTSRLSEIAENERVTARA